MFVCTLLEAPEHQAHSSIARLLSWGTCAWSTPARLAGGRGPDQAHLWLELARLVHFLWIVWQVSGLNKVRLDNVSV